MFCKVLNNQLVQCLDRGGALHEGQAGFRVNRSCMDNVYTLHEIVQDRFRKYMLSFQIYRKHMILCGAMVCG